MGLADQLGTLMGERNRLTDQEMAHRGLTLAKVTNLKDPEGLNRVKCLPIEADDSDETDWCYVMAPMGGAERGMFFFPQIDDLVVLGWLGGDPHQPMVLGAFWNTEVKPPVPIKDGKAEDYVIRTPGGIELFLHDTKDEQTITLTAPSGTFLKVDDKEQKVTLQDKDGKNNLVMDWKNGELNLKAEKKLTVTVGKSSLAMDSDGNCTLKGEAKLSFQGKDIEAKANSNIKATANSNFEAKGSSKLAMQGAQGEIKTDGNLALKAGGNLTTQGMQATMKATGKLSLQGMQSEVKGTGQLNLQASGIATLKGAMVKIN